MVSNPIRRMAGQLYVYRGPAVDVPTAKRCSACLIRPSNRPPKRPMPSSPSWSPTSRPETASGQIFFAIPATLRYIHLPPRSSWVLDLDPDVDDLLAAMKPKWRYNIRLATKKGVEVSRGTPANIDAFYRMYAETARRRFLYP